MCVANSEFMARRISWHDAEKTAQRATKITLAEYELPENLTDHIVLTSITPNHEDDTAVFMLYIPGEDRSDYYTIADVFVNLYTREVNVEVPNLKKRS